MTWTVRVRRAEQEDQGHGVAGGEAPGAGEAHALVREVPAVGQEVKRQDPLQLAPRLLLRLLKRLQVL